VQLLPRRFCGCFFLVVIPRLLLRWLYGCCLCGCKALLWRCTSAAVVAKRCYCSGGFSPAAVWPTKLLLGDSAALVELWYCEAVVFV
jgi:hypothetical protein